jgi:GNAT superfamily N-acetyltransferase
MKILKVFIILLSISMPNTYALECDMTLLIKLANKNKFSRARIKEMSTEELHQHFSVRPTVNGYFAFIGDTPIGRMGVSTIYGKDKQSVALQIQTVWLAPEARGKALGSFLYREVAKRAPGGVLLSDNSVSQKAVELWEKLGEKNPDLNVTDMRAHIDQWQAAQREKAAQGQKIKSWRSSVGTIESRPKFILRAKDKIAGEAPLVNPSLSQQQWNDEILKELNINADEYN